MSRARNIKPGFFKNELLVELPFEYRLLFIGLWTMSDREGRFEDRPTKIRMELFPADAVDVNAGLQALHDNGFIFRYEADGKRFCQVVAWAKHQNPHVKEGSSSIPAPVMHGASMVLEPEEYGSSPADSSLSDPPSRIPDSLGEIGTREPITSAGEAAVAMRKAGCVSINQSNPDFLAALAEGVTAKELADAVEASSATANGAGLFNYAVKVARTNHAKTATVIAPNSRAGPQRGGGGKIMGLLQTLEGMKDGLDQSGISNGLPDDGHARLGGSAGS